MLYSRATPGRVAQRSGVPAFDGSNDLERIFANEFTDEVRIVYAHGSPCYGHGSLDEVLRSTRLTGASQWCLDMTKKIHTIHFKAFSVMASSPRYIGN